MSDWFADPSEQAPFEYRPGTVDTYTDGRGRERIRVLDRYDRWHLMPDLPLHITPMDRINRIHDFKRQVMDEVTKRED